MGRSERNLVQLLIQRFLDRTPSTDSAARLIRALVLLLLGLSVGIGAAAADIYLHRGIESGAEQPYVVQPTGRELSTNVDLTPYDANQLEQIAGVLAKNGFRYVRQTFAWADIEPQQDTFVWDRYELIVSTLQRHGIQVIAVLHRSPTWARAPENGAFFDAAPQFIGDYADFVGEVATHFGQRVTYFQIWDLPNRPENWGGMDARASDYVLLLADAFNAIRTANFEAKVILAEFDPVYPGGGIGADLAFLRKVYKGGGAPFFDVVAARIDGGSASPYDRQVEPGRQDFSRAVLFRELMTAENDDSKPIWLTHFGWSIDSHDVTAEQQADFTVAGIKRARAEWPWLGLMFNWSLIPNPNTPGDAGFSLLTAQGAANPAFVALGEYAAGGSGAVAATGYVSMDAASVTYEGTWSPQHLDGITFRTTSEIGATSNFQFRGTGVIAYVRISPQAGLVHATIDGEPLPGWPEVDGKSVVDLSAFQAQSLPVPLASGLADTNHTLSMTLIEQGQLTVGGLIVSRDPPLLWPVISLIMIAVGMVAFGLRDVVYVIAIHSNALQRRSGVDLRPPLPRLPDWRPARKF
jgi:hypothetical protein